jgi:uncharacterized small protein (DUF1192 family)
MSIRVLTTTKLKQLRVEELELRINVLQDSLTLLKQMFAQKPDKNGISAIEAVKSK